MPALVRHLNGDKVALNVWKCSLAGKAVKCLKRWSDNEVPLVKNESYMVVFDPRLPQITKERGVKSLHFHSLLSESVLGARAES